MPSDAASKSPGLARLASVKAPASKPNSSASSKQLRDGGAVDLDEGPLRPWAAVMNDPRHQPLPGAGFPMQQHSRDERIPEGVERHQVAKLRAQGDDGGCLSHQALGGMDGGDETWAGHSVFRFLSQAHRWPVAPCVATIAISGATF